MALRVVAGEAGGRHLVAPKGARPTADRVKESLFAALGDELVTGATVLDLFAGSGALGIEALSRGAARAVFVDRDRHAEQAIRTNLATTGFGPRARVERAPVTSFLRRALPEGAVDLVFLDPPYDSDRAAVDHVLATLATVPWLAAGATVIVESRRQQEPSQPPGWSVTWQRAYGDTLLTISTVTASTP